MFFFGYSRLSNNLREGTDTLNCGCKSASVFAISIRLLTLVLLAAGDHASVLLQAEDGWSTDRALTGEAGAAAFDGGAGGGAGGGGGDQSAAAVRGFAAGNASVADHFHELFVDGDSLLLGARNVVYNLSLETFTENSRLEWFSSYEDVQMCLMRQKSEEECQNYIRVLARRTDGSYLVCGTNAYRPVCRVYTYNEAVGSYIVTESDSGVARCPYDPSHNSTAIFVNDRLYSATVADLSSRDPLIYSKPLRTEQHDSQWLNDPSFVSTFHYNEMVYFFFRETAVEHINCGKTVFSRVARVCTSDEGGVRVLRNTWTSFFKARLNCSIPGEFPFYFDEIQSTSELGEGNAFPTLIYNDRIPMVYAVFTTPRNSLRGSAVCAFKMSDVIASFEGPHKEQKTAYSNWLPVRDADIPDPHPAKGCGNGSTLLSDQSLNFIKSHPLMDRAVPAFNGQPLFVHSSLEYSLTQIAVDWQVPAVDRQYYDVMFIGTDNGRVLKVINRSRQSGRVDSFVIEDLRVFDRSTAVTGLRIYRRSGDDHKSARLIVMSRGAVRSLPLHRCHLRTSCLDCVALRDPYCSWVDDKCIHSATGYQSIETGRHSHCPLPVITTPHQKSSLKPSMSSLLKVCPPCSCKFNSPFDITNSHPQSPLETNFIDTMDSRDFGDDEIDNEIFIGDGSSSLRHSGRLPAVVPCYKASLGSRDDDGLYTGSSVAAITVLSIIASLLAGFVAGFCLSSHRHLRCLYRRIDHLWGFVGGGGPAGGSGLDDAGIDFRTSPRHGKKCVGGSMTSVSSSSKRHHAVQNAYDLDPVKYQIPGGPTVTASQHYNPLPRRSKDVNVIFNEFKANNLDVAAGCNGNVVGSDSEAIALCLSTTRPLPCVSNCEVDACLGTCNGIVPPRPPPRRHRSVRR